nr:ABC transporter permease [Bacteroidota bacterium]
MNKIWILTKREFLTSVRTRSFIVGLILAPVLMGGGLIVVLVSKGKVDVKDKMIAVLDHTEKITPRLIEYADARNQTATIDPESSKKIRPAYLIENVVVDSLGINNQKLELSEHVRNKQLHAFVEIGPDVIHPMEEGGNHRIVYYSENSAIDDLRDWMSSAINQQLRSIRADELNIDADVSQELFFWINTEGMGLVKVDESTGDVADARASSLLDALAVPYILVMIMFMMVMMFTIPLLSAVMEEKSERIAEVLLGSVTPFQFMMGKVLGSIMVSLIGSSVYIVGGAIFATQAGYAESVPYHLLPWFFAFLILEIIMVGSIMASVGSACSNSKDAQSLSFPAMLPVLVPMFVMFPILKDPLSGFSTIISLIPPLTPMLMMVRQATPVSIPEWQPIVGLLGVVLFTLFSVWLGGRIFRTQILLQGKPPKFFAMVKMALKG